MSLDDHGTIYCTQTTTCFNFTEKDTCFDSFWTKVFAVSIVGEKVSPIPLPLLQVKKYCRYSTAIASDTDINEPWLWPLMSIAITYNTT